MLKYFGPSLFISPYIVCVSAATTSTPRAQSPPFVTPPSVSDLLGEHMGTWDEELRSNQSGQPSHPSVCANPTSPSSLSSSQNPQQSLLALQLQIHQERVSLQLERAQFDRLRQSFVHSAPQSANQDQVLIGELRSAAAPADAFSGPADTARLRRQLQAAEEEARSSLEQLRASNAEFLLLRERVSHGQVERAYLKETVEGLDEQVIRNDIVYVSASAVDEPASTTPPLLGVR